MEIKTFFLLYKSMCIVSYAQKSRFRFNNFFFRVKRLKSSIVFKQNFDGWSIR